MDVRGKTKDGPRRAKLMRAMKRLMYEQGLNGQDLARAVGVTDATISAWMRGHYLPKAQRVDRLARALGLTVSELVDIIDPPRRPRPVVTTRA